ELELDVDWVEPDAPAAHPFDDGTALVLERDLEATAVGLGRDADPYRGLVGRLVAAWPQIERVLLGPLPLSPSALLDVRARLGTRGLVEAVRSSLAAARPLAESRFAEERTRGWFAGHAAHSMLPLERRPSGGFGLALLALGHSAGWPFPRGGARRISEALLARLGELGGRVHPATPVDEFPRADVVLADVLPRELVRLAGDRLPVRYERALLRFRHGPGAFKLDWALSGPIPWRDPACSRAATIHLGGSLDALPASARPP